MPEVHATIGGSVAGRYIQCPWSLANMHRAKIESNSSAAAAEGTALHELLEKYYLGKIETIESMLGKEIRGVEMTQDRIDRALDASRALDAYCDQLE